MDQTRRLVKRYIKRSKYCNDLKSSYVVPFEANTIFNICYKRPRRFKKTLTRGRRSAKWQSPFVIKIRMQSSRRQALRAHASMLLEDQTNKTLHNSNLKMAPVEISAPTSRKHSL